MNARHPTEYIIGVHTLIELLKAKRRKVYAVYTTKPFPKAWDQIAPLLPSYIEVHPVSRDELTRRAQTSDHQSIVAAVQPYPYRTKPFEKEKYPFLVMLDGVQDVGNVGAIIRSAYCAGAQGVILCKKGGASLTAAACKASAGLAEHVEVYCASSASVAVQELKKAGYQIYVADFGGANAFTVPYQLPLCLVVGSEGQGVHDVVLQAGTVISIPQKEGRISYNASVAAGILLVHIGSRSGLVHS